MGGGTGRDRETARQEGAAAGRLAAKKFDGLHRRLSWPEVAVRSTLSLVSSLQGIVAEKLSSVRQPSGGRKSTNLVNYRPDRRRRAGEHSSKRSKRVHFFTNELAMPGNQVFSFLISPRGRSC